ncbi:hypothetical protein CHU_2551 [Cytophaga hutchinsonii ATCC 33406]|uniref:Uncharacterized protein n=1 Tax=Cytophaga hutchinsonii (strain ATCC 33406 / DSM 1761 / CIP 103989 / NBRC 15051 / NCIMB 9469 / D465) TaxID=269798 RepID=A0A6N4STV2_CYTH3|nr:hypothetical protein CHU_2551 [Cytophaga hutchinsonii ATCC 33406]
MICFLYFCTGVENRYKNTINILNQPACAFIPSDFMLTLSSFLCEQKYLILNKFIHSRIILYIRVTNNHTNPLIQNNILNIFNVSADVV